MLTNRVKIKLNKNLTSLDQFIEKEFDPVGSKKRDKFDAGYEALKLGVLIQQARQERGLTQEQLADLCETTNLIFQN